MKKMNNKGYMLVEIIMAFAITFTLLYFMMDLVLKMKNNNDDLLVETVVKTDSTIIINKLMEYAKADVTNQSEAKNFCTKIKVNGKNVEYGDKVVAVVDDTATISYDSKENCSASSGRLKIRIPVTVKQMNDENFDIVLDHYYDYRAVCNPVNSYKCGDVCSDGECDGSKIYAIEYDGRCNVIDDGNGNWRVKFLEEGKHTLKVNCDMYIDAFLVGGGGGGGSNLGSGGGGGYTNTTFANIKSGESYSLVIGNGGLGGIDDGRSATDGEDTTGFGAIAQGGGGAIGGNGGVGTGGSGGGGSSYSDTSPGVGGSDGSNGSDGDEERKNGGTGQGRTTREFGEPTGTLYSGGGGGSSKGYGGLGGAGGGGDGAGGYSNGSDGKVNTGGGGGGGANNYDGGAGGSGIIVIRNTRNNSGIENLPSVDFDFTYTGNYTIINDSDGNWRIKFLTSGTFISSEDLYIDAFLVGGGGGGASNLGSGGAGGYTNTTFANIKSGEPYSLVIGDGGPSNTNGEDTTGFGAIAQGGGGAIYNGNVGTGGSGGGGSGYDDGGDGGSDGYNGSDGDEERKNGGTGQGRTTREFGEPTGTLYSGGGGGSSRGYGGLGGAGGGGSGGMYYTSGSYGALNTGGGGGGGFSDRSGGTGGSGIIVIRNTRNNSGIENLPSVGFDFTYTGKYTIINDSNGNWRIKFLTSGTFLSFKDLSIDAFLVGGGGGGNSNVGGGGGGGYTTTSSVSVIANINYVITIGDGGPSNTDGEDTTGFNLIADGGSRGTGYRGTGGPGGSGGGGYYGGKGGSGGSAGNAGSDISGGTGQGRTTREFGEPTGTLYSGGGGGSSKGYGGLGGSGGGGAGGNYYTNGSYGALNTGGGGGGGFSDRSGGSGGSGILIIRNARGD